MILMVLTVTKLKLTLVSRLRSIRPSSTARDIFLEKVGFKDIFHQLNYKGIFELLLFEAIPSLKLSFNPGWGGGAKDPLPLGLLRE